MLSPFRDACRARPLHVSVSVVASWAYCIVFCLVREQQAQVIDRHESVGVAVVVTLDSYERLFAFKRTFRIPIPAGFSIVGILFVVLDKYELCMTEQLYDGPSIVVG